jgi:hypothetical protein
VKFVPVPNTAEDELTLTEETVPAILTYLSIVFDAEKSFLE